MGLPASGACDCHVHVVGSMHDYPMVPERHYTPGPAPVADLQEHLTRNGLQRTVIIQPSFYGTDNSCMLQALHDLQGAGRGIAVLDASASDADLRVLHSQGIRGLRLNVESSATGDTQAVSVALHYWAERIAALGWHLQIYASLDALQAMQATLQTVRVPIVLDHFAMVQDNTLADDTRYQAVLHLVQTGRAYVKLSAPYRIQSTETPKAEAVARIAQRYVQANPERVLWGSDWPHTHRESGKSAHEVSAYRSVGRETLLGGLHAWLPSEALRQRVLVDNPAQLYGF